MKNGTFEDSDGNIEWWFNGNLHREYGPALVCANGHKEWWIAGQEFNKNEFQHWLDKKNLNTKLETNLHTKSVLKRSKI